MPTFWYIILALAIAGIGGFIGAVVGVNATTKLVKDRFLRLNGQIENQDKRICTLEDERRGLRIRYNALVGWSERVIDIFKKIGFNYPEPPHRPASD